MCDPCATAGTPLAVPSLGLPVKPVCWEILLTCEVMLGESGLP